MAAIDTLNNPMDILINSISEMSIQSNSPQIKQKQYTSARETLFNLPFHKLDKIIDIISRMQSENLKGGLDLIFHNTCNNILQMIMDRKRLKI